MRDRPRTNADGAARRMPPPPTSHGRSRPVAHPCLLRSSARPRPARRPPATMSMFDPLSVPNFPQDEPPWPTKPHSPSDPIPNLPRPSPHHEPRGPPAGLYGKEPQIYGQPEPALISPRLNPGSNGTQFERKEPYLRVRITTLDRNRRDVLIKFDAQVRLPLSPRFVPQSPN